MMVLFSAVSNGDRRATVGRRSVWETGTARTSTMTLQEQIKMPDIEIMSSLPSLLSSSSSPQLQWNSTNQWSPPFNEEDGHTRLMCF